MIEYGRDDTGDTDRYVNPLSERYASREIQYTFSPDMKFRTWRRLQIALVEIEKGLGSGITDEQVEELRTYTRNTNYDVTKAREKEVRHDVMSHVYTYGMQYPKVKDIIRLGAISCYVRDNTDIIIVTEALKLVREKLLSVFSELPRFANNYKGLPTPTFTYFQPTQPTTVGKRATLWMMELKLDLDDLDYVIRSVHLFGSKGTTGVQVSFLELFDGDHGRCRRLDQRIAEKMGFEGCYPVSGQTYSRKINRRVINVLTGIVQSTHKFSSDICLLQHLEEVEEPFEKKQIGSSAVACKRNPTCSERIALLANYMVSDMMNPILVVSTQWFERALDGSTNKRLSVPEGFLATDGILNLYLSMVDGLMVYPKMIEEHLMAELPFMATENIMMNTIEAGEDRQEFHKRIRELSMEAGRNIKEKGLDNNLLELIATDPASSLPPDDPKTVMDLSRYVGRSSRQVGEPLGEVISPILSENADGLGIRVEINVWVPPVI